MKRLLGFALIVAALAGCTSDPYDDAQADSGNTTGGDVEPGASGPSQVARGTADEQRIDCAAVNQQRGDGPDIAGVTIGMTAELAFSKVACANPVLRVEYQNSGGFSLPGLPDGQQPRRQIVANGGQEDFIVTLVGLPGQERVVTIYRRINFGAGQEPVMTALLGQIEQKYGTLQRSPYENNGVQGGVLRSADNRPIGADNSGMFNRCMPSSGPSTNIYEDCGISVGVRIGPKSENPQLAQSLIVSITHGQYGMQQIEAFQAAATRMAQERSQAEVNAAAGRTPTL